MIETKIDYRFLKLMFNRLQLRYKSLIVSSSIESENFKTVFIGVVFFIHLGYCESIAASYFQNLEISIIRVEPLKLKFRKFSLAEF